MNSDRLPLLHALEGCRRIAEWNIDHHDDQLATLAHMIIGNVMEMLRVDEKEGLHAVMEVSIVALHFPAAASIGARHALDAGEAEKLSKAEATLTQRRVGALTAEKLAAHAWPQPGDDETER